MISHIIKTSLIIQISSRILPRRMESPLPGIKTLWSFSLQLTHHCIFLNANTYDLMHFPSKLIRRSRIFHEHGNKRRPVRKPLTDLDESMTGSRKIYSVNTTSYYGCVLSIFPMRRSHFTNDVTIYMIRIKPNQEQNHRLSRLLPISPRLMPLHQWHQVRHLP